MQQWADSEVGRTLHTGISIVSPLDDIRPGDINRILFRLRVTDGKLSHHFESPWTQAEDLCERAHHFLTASASAVEQGHTELGKPSLTDEAALVTVDWFKSIGLRVDPVGLYHDGDREPLLIPEPHEEVPDYFRYGVRQAPCDGSWCLYRLSGDGFDGTEDFLVEVPTRGHFRHVCNALRIRLPNAK